MRNLLHATDRDRLIAHLRGALLREVTVGGRRLRALAEAEGAEGGSFCAAPANVRAAELLVQPEVRDGDPAFADGVLDFVMAMAEAPLPCRRAAAGGIEVLRDDPRNFEILTPFHRFTGDLSAGMVRQQLRGAAAPPVLHTGNLVEFRLGRHRNAVDVEDNIRDCAILRQGEGVVLRHESRIAGKAGLVRTRQAEAGVLRYDYAIMAGSPLLRLTVTFVAAKQKVQRLRLTTAVDQLGSNGLELAEGRVAVGAGPAAPWKDQPVPQAAGVAAWAEATPARHLAIGAAGWPAGAPTLHIRPGAPAGVVGVKAIAARPGALHWLILRHGGANLAPGATLVVQEDRLLAAGTQAEAAEMAMRAAGQPGVAGLDLDPLPTDGAALNAVATQILLAARGAYRVPLPVARVVALEAWLDRHMAALTQGQPSLPDLAHAVLAAEARLRAGSGPAAGAGQVENLVRRLLALQKSNGCFQENGRGATTLAGQALALLALARAVPHLDPLALGGPIARALAVIHPGTVEMEEAGRMVRVDGMALDGAVPAPLRQHAEAVGLVARAAGAVLLAAEARPEAVPAEALAAAQSLHRQAIALVRPLVRARGAALEVAPSPLGGTASPTGQAAVVLGLMAPDAAILRLATASA